MREIAAKLAATMCCWAALAAPALAQTMPAGAVQAAAIKFDGGVSWRAGSVLAADFSCIGKVQAAILGASAGEIVVAIFTAGLDQAPALLRFEADDRNVGAAKIRVDDYTLTAEEIAGVSGARPSGYRPTTACHGVRLSDDTSAAAHIYWDHEHQRFDSWTQ